MIVNMTRGDILKAPYSNIAFAVNTEGYNDAGFAGMISSRYWLALTNTGEKKLGEVMSNKADGKTFHALVCHSLRGDGWERTPDMVANCLDALDVPESETIAVVLMGSGMVGKMGGADVYAILGGMARSKKKVAVYTL